MGNSPFGKIVKVLTADPQNPVGVTQPQVPEFILQDAVYFNPFPGAQHCTVVIEKITLFITDNSYVV